MESTAFDPVFSFVASVSANLYSQEVKKKKQSGGLDVGWGEEVFAVKIRRMEGVVAGGQVMMTRGLSRLCVLLILTVIFSELAWAAEKEK